MVALASPRFDGALRAATAGSIRLYQLWLSPHKGFCCAYRHRTERHSCSEHARRLVLRQGLLALIHGLPRRFARCRAAYTAIRAEAAEPDRREDEAARRRRERREDWGETAADACSDAVDLVPADGAGACGDAASAVPAECAAGACSF